jgi:2-isopropylmalate synthase
MSNHAHDATSHVDASALGLPSSVQVYDTTLRDGSQQEGISLTIDDKLRVAEQLDHLGVRWIEGGYPGANPKDAAFFQRAQTELKLDTSTLLAFGSTRRPKGKVDVDDGLRTLVESGVSTACIVGKSWDFHVTEALRTTLDEGVAMVADSVRFLKAAGLRVFFDAEHFFDGYKNNPEYALRILEAAATEDVDTLVLCDTNGGSLPHQVQATAAVLAGATQLQGTINGYGERTGNANLMVCIPNLTLKLGIRTLPEGRMERLTEVSHHVAELVNLPPDHAQPYVGVSAFAHKAGLHTSAIARRPDSYEHVDPVTVGNGTRFLVSDLAGRATMELKAKEMGLELDGKAAGEVAERLKQLESEGFHFETADASLELLMRSASGWQHNWFRLDRYRVTTYHRDAVDDDDQVDTECTMHLWIDGEKQITVGEGNGPVNALDHALRNALASRYPALARIHLTDYKVRVLDSSAATGAKVRVLIDSTNGDRSWTTIGVDANVIEASWQALVDSIVFGLLHTTA